MEERFREIDGYPYYYVSDHGRVYSSLSKGFIGTLDSKGYPRVSLYNSDDGSKETITIHLLVAREFVDKPDSDIELEVNHIDGIKTNNHYTNLEWVTHQQNIQHSWDNNLQVVTDKFMNHVNKMAIERKRRVRCIETGEIFDSCKEAAEAVNSTIACVSNAANPSQNNKIAGGYSWEYLDD